MKTPRQSIKLEEEQRQLLEEWVRAHRTPQQVVKRCQIILRSHSSLQAHRANPLDHAQDGQGAGSPRQQFWTKISTVSVVPTIRSTVSLTAFSSRGEVAGSRDWPNRSRSSFISGLRGYPQSLEQPAPRM